MDEVKRCKAVKSNGQPCQSQILDAQGLCRTHGGRVAEPRKCEAPVGSGSHVSTCGRRLADGEEACVEHRWLLDPMSVGVRIALAKHAVDIAGARADAVRDEMAKLSRAVQEARDEKAKLDRQAEELRTKIDLLLAKERDAELLDQAEKAITGGDHARGAALVELVKERRQQRRESVEGHKPEPARSSAQPQRRKIPT